MDQAARMMGVDASSIRGATRIGNGTYYTLDGYSVYVPDYVTSHTEAFIYYPGSGGAWPNDASRVKSYIDSGQANQIIVISNDAYSPSSTGGERFIRLIHNIGSANNTQINRIDNMCFSASGPAGFNTIVNIASQNPEAHHTAVFADVNSFNPTAEQIQTLKNSNTSLLFIEPNGTTTSFANTLAANGVDVYMVWARDGAHVAINRDILEGGLISFLSGETDTLSNASDYKLVKYDAASGQWVTASFDDVRSAFSGYPPLSIPGLDLKGSYPAGTIESDLSLAMSHVNEIRTNMVTDEPSKLSFRSTTSFPANLGECQDALLGISNDLTATLDRHTQIIAGIARAFYEDDQHTASVIRATLGDGTSYTLSGGVDSMNTEISRTIALEKGISFNSFMFPATGGSGGRLYLSDLTSITGGALKGTVSSETQAAEKIATSINSLQADISGSAKLSGPAWEAVSNKLDGYHELMSFRKTAVSDFEAAAVKAANLLATWMGDEFTVLDDSKLGELKSTYEEIKRNFEEAKTVVTKTYWRWFRRRYVYSAESRARAKAYIDWALEKIPIINKYIRKLSELAGKVAEAEQIMNSALHQIYTSYAVPVANFAGSSGYTAPANTSYTPTPVDFEEIDLDVYPHRSTLFSGELTEEEFNNNQHLVDKWGTYENYLNRVKAKNDPAFNTGMQDNGQESTNDFAIPEGDVITIEQDDGQTPAPAEAPNDNDTSYRQQTPASTPSYTPSYTPSQTPSTTTPSTETPTIEPTPEPEPEPTLIETPVEVTPIEVTPIDETPIEPTIAEETPTDTTPVEATPVEETPAEPTPVEHTPTEATEVSGTPIVSTKPDRPSTSSPSTPSRKPDPEPEIVEVDPQPVPIEEGTSLIGGMSSPNALEMEEDFVFGTNDDTNVVTIENPTPAITSRNDSKSIGIVAGLAAAAATGYGVYKYNKDKDEDDDSNEDFEPIDNTEDFNEDLSDEPENFVV